MSVHDQPPREPPLPVWMKACRGEASENGRWLDWLFARFNKNDEPMWAHEALGDPNLAEGVVGHILNRPDGIRQRALNAATIAGGAAAALGALAAVVGVGSRSVEVRSIVTGALVLWLASVFLYVQAITYSWRSTTPPTGTGDMLKKFNNYSNAMRARVRFGSYVASAAVVLTIAAIVAIAVGLGDDKVQSVWLRPSAAGALPTCEPKHEAQNGSVKVKATAAVADLGKSVVPIKLPCTDERTYRVPGKAIVATEQRD